MPRLTILTILTHITETRHPLPSSGSAGKFPDFITRITIFNVVSVTRMSDVYDAWFIMVHDVRFFPNLNLKKKKKKVFVNVDFKRTVSSDIEVKAVNKQDISDAPWLSTAEAPHQEVVAVASRSCSRLPPAVSYDVVLMKL